MLLDDPEAICVRIVSSPDCCGVVIASLTAGRAARGDRQLHMLTCVGVSQQRPHMH